MFGLSATERHEAIVAALRQSSRVGVVDLAERLRVSVVTIRKDLEQLERQQVLRRMRGGAIAVHPARFERSLHLPTQTFSEEKQRIAELAVSLVRDGETIIIDAGSTTLTFARALPRTLEDVAVVTNALDIAIELETHPGVRVVVTGGTMRRQARSLVSPFAANLLGEINADAAYLSCSGISASKGFTTSNWEEAEVKHAMVRASSRTIVLADIGKIGHVGTARIMGIAEADLLVTNVEAAPDAIRDLEAAGLQILQA